MGSRGFLRSELYSLGGRSISMGLLDAMSGGQPTTAAPPVTPDNAGAAFSFFVSQGLAPHQAAGIVGNLMGESGQRLNPNAINPGDGRDGSDSIGIGQWNGTRAAALKAYANSKGTNWNDLNTQLEFLHSELKGPEGKAYAALQAASNPEEAARAFLGYERPKDWNVPGSHPERAKYAVQAFNAYSGGAPIAATPVASAIMGKAPAAAPTVASQIMGTAPSVEPLAGGAPPIALAAPDPIRAMPIQFAQRRSPDLSKLKALFGTFNARG